MPTTTTIISHSVEHSDQYEWTGEVRCVQQGDLCGIGWDDCHQQECCRIASWNSSDPSEFMYPIFREKWRPKPEWRFPDRCFVFRCFRSWWIGTESPVPLERSDEGYKMNTGEAVAVRCWLAMHGLSLADFVPPPVDCVEVKP